MMVTSKGVARRITDTVVTTLAVVVEPIGMLACKEVIQGVA